MPTISSSRSSGVRAKKNGTAPSRGFSWMVFLPVVIIVLVAFNLYLASGKLGMSTDLEHGRRPARPAIDADSLMDKFLLENPLGVMDPPKVAAYHRGDAPKRVRQAKKRNLEDLVKNLKDRGPVKGNMKTPEEDAEEPQEYIDVLAGEKKRAKRPPRREIPKRERRRPPKRRPVIKRERRRRPPPERRAPPAREPRERPPVRQPRAEPVKRVNAKAIARSIAKKAGEVPVKPRSRVKGKGEMGKTLARGQFASHGTNMCLDTLGNHEGGSPGLYACHHNGGTQAWQHIRGMQLKNTHYLLCLGTIIQKKAKHIYDLHLVDCDSTSGRLKWERLITHSDPETAQFRLKDSGEDAVTGNGGMCLTVQGGSKLALDPCVSSKGRSSTKYEKQRFRMDSDQDLAERKRRIQDKMANYDFNEERSREIGIRRARPDLQHGDCKRLPYDLKKISKTSVIICFVNEEWFALLRTIHSVIDGSPPELIKEIILVDDGSDKEWLFDELENYIRDELPGYVKLVRTGARTGLIKARLAGARAASGEILTFLDSHIEVSEGWLPPLLKRVTDDPTVAACPVITVIGQEYLEHQTSVDHYNIAYGIFDWALTFKWQYIRSVPPPGPKRTEVTDPIKSPTMAGGLYSINRKWFYKVGSYDKAMEGWGGENIEMSFRLWMCGGSIEIIPCSLVGHIFRRRNPSPFKKNVILILRWNLGRLAEVWMDEYKELFYEQNPGARNAEKGDLTDRFQLRKNLQCHSFEWYLHNVYPSLSADLPHDIKMKGSLRLTSVNSEDAICSDFLVDDPVPNKRMMLRECDIKNKKRQWVMWRKDLHITGAYFPAMTTCLESKGRGKDARWMACDPNNANQKWILSEDGALKSGNDCLVIKGDLLMGGNGRVEDCKHFDIIAYRWKIVQTNSVSHRLIKKKKVKPKRKQKDYLLISSVLGHPYTAKQFGSMFCDEGKDIPYPADCEGNNEQATLQECADACDLADGCNSFSRSRRTGDCWLKQTHGNCDDPELSPKDCAGKPGYSSYMRRPCKEIPEPKAVKGNSGPLVKVVVPKYKGTAYHGKLGLGDDGRPLWEPKPVPDIERIQGEIRLHGFNASLSQSIPLDRVLHARTHPECKKIDYGDLGKLPDTSVVFVFCNEEQSVLYRSIHSVLNLSPSKLLKEIILVDDGSDLPWLFQELEDYITHLPKVTLLRTGKRVGLVQARLTGMRAATAKTVTILDSHIEVQPGWLEPLMNYMKDDNSRVALPMIDSLSAKDFQPASAGIELCGFLWKMVEHGIPLQSKDAAARKHPNTDPEPSPVMAGGLFSVNKDWFLNTLGGYDEGIEFWGTENLEMSFRVWMCGGRMEMLPCSRVYHVFRTLGGKPYHIPGTSLLRNKLRAVRGWMGKWGHIALKALGPGALTDDGGDLSLVRQTQSKLQCKDFTWYLDNVYPENVVYQSIRGSSYSGAIVNKKNNICLTVLGTSVSMAPCGKPEKRVAEYQDFYYNRQSELRVGTEVENCVTAPDTSGRFSKHGLSNKGCYGYTESSQRWHYDPKSNKGQHPGQIRSALLSGNCLDARATLAKCVTQPGDDLENQIWVFEENEKWK